MTNKELYREYLQELQQLYSSNEAAVITDWVFEKVAGLQRADIIKNPGHNLSPEKVIILKEYLNALLQHMPVQYVLEEAWFYNMKLKVNEHVLVPRPETEELVQLVLNDWKLTEREFESSAIVLTNETSIPLSMLDIGTGSGCIAIALKKNLQGILMHAIDISNGALAVAKENALHYKVDIQFLQTDFLDEQSWKHLPVVDVIISNPPYIPINEKERLDMNVSAFEPHNALFVPENAPMLFYEKIAAFGKTHLKQHGKIYVEIHENFANETVAIFESLYNVDIQNDIFGKQRMLIAAKKQPAL